MEFCDFPFWCPCVWSVYYGTLLLIGTAANISLLLIKRINRIVSTVVLHKKKPLNERCHLGTRWIIPVVCLHSIYVAALVGFTGAIRHIEFRFHELKDLWQGILVSTSAVGTPLSSLFLLNIIDVHRILFLIMEKDCLVHNLAVVTQRSCLYILVSTFILCNNQNFFIKKVVLITRKARNSS